MGATASLERSPVVEDGLDGLGPRVLAWLDWLPRALAFLHLPCDRKRDTKGRHGGEN